MSVTLPQTRVNLRNLSSNNQSLQDIIKSCTMATEVVSVEPYSGKIHNTKMVLRIDKGISVPMQERYIERVQFYNRLNIVDVLADANWDEDADEGEDLIDYIINQLNRQGFDFTTDDIELVGGNLKAKIYSLGYYNPVTGDCTPTTFSWNPVTNPITLDSNKMYVLSYILTIDGIVDERRRVVTYSGQTPTSLFALAKELFTYSGNDLMRQHYMGVYFDYSPAYTDGVEGDPFIISGRSSADDVPNGNYEFTPKSAELKLVPMTAFDLRDYGDSEDLVISAPGDYLDYVQLQFGGEVILHSCGALFNTGV